MRPIRIGFVGVGAMGQCAHLRNYAILPEADVVALAEVRPELGKRVAARYGVPHVHASLEEMLDAEELDALVAPQPFTRHGALLPRLMDQGVPLLCEKPLAGSVEAGERILAALDRRGLWMMVAYHKRSDPATEYVKAETGRLRATGELGALRYVRIVMPKGDWVAGGFDDLIRTDEPVPPAAEDPPPPDMDAPTREAYRSFVNYYIHQINLMRHLLGEPYRVVFAARSGALLAVESESGATGAIEMSPYATTVGWEESALVAFERGYVRLSLPAPLARNRPGAVEVYRDPGDGATPQRLRPTLPWEDAMRRQAANFLRAVRGDAPPPCEAHEALEDLKVAREYIRMLGRA